MPRYKFSWDNLPLELLRPLVEELHLDGGDPAEDLKAEFGARPTEDFVREAWDVLEERWLNHDPQALDQVVEALWQRGRDGYRRPLGPQEQLGCLAAETGLLGSGRPSLKRSLQLASAPGFRRPSRRQLSSGSGAVISIADRPTTVRPKRSTCPLSPQPEVE